MCNPNRKPCLTASARAVHEALLALHEALARYNASIRVLYPPSANVARVMEKNTSGWINDAPFLIQEFKLAAEDAICAEQAKEYYLGDGVNEILDATQDWAGYTPIDDKGREVWRKRVSIVERGLFDLVQVRANAFFGSVWRLKLLGASASTLVPEQQRFKRKHDAMEAR